MLRKVKVLNSKSVSLLLPLVATTVVSRDAAYLDTLNVVVLCVRDRKEAEVEVRMVQNVEVHRGHVAGVVVQTQSQRHRAVSVNHIEDFVDTNYYG